MKCRQCGKTIGPKDDYFTLCILDDPALCSVDCVEGFIKGHQKEIDDYVEEYMTSREVHRDVGEVL